MAKKKRRGKRDKSPPRPPGQLAAVASAPLPAASNPLSLAEQPTSPSSFCGDVASTLTDLMEQTTDNTDTTNSDCCGSLAALSNTNSMSVASTGGTSNDNSVVGGEPVLVEASATQEKPSPPRVVAKSPSVDSATNQGKSYNKNESLNSILDSTTSTASSTNPGKETMAKTNAQERKAEKKDEGKKAVSSPEKKSSCCKSKNKKEKNEGNKNDDAKKPPAKIETKEENPPGTTANTTNVGSPTVPPPKSPPPSPPKTTTTTPPAKTAGCCASKKKTTAEKKEPTEQTENKTSAEAKTTTTQSAATPPPSAPTTSKPSGSCCASKKKKAITPASTPVPSTNTTTPIAGGTCCGCGDDCRCCRENGWSKCQCGPNCTCTNPLMTEQASLLLACTNQQQPQTQNIAAFASRSTDTTTTDDSAFLLKAPPTMDTSADLTVDLEANTPSTTKKKKNLYVDIVVGGMTCTMCSQAITNALTNNIAGVTNVQVSLSTDVAHIDLDPLVDDNYHTVVEQIQNTIADIGYMVVDVMLMPNAPKAPPQTSTTTMEDANTLTDPLLPQGGDEEAPNSNDTTTNTQQDRWNRIAQRQEEKLQERKRAFLWSLAGTSPILILTMIVPHILPQSAADWWDAQHVHLLGATIPLESLLLLVLATPVQFVCGWDFYKGTYYGLVRSGTLNMDVLVCLGSTASWGYAVWATLANQVAESHFFETSAVLICFVLLGKWMQAVAVHRTSDALTSLMQLQPSTAIRVMPMSSSATIGSDATATTTNWDPMTQAYSETVIPTDQLQPGDIVKIVPGASLPADGVVVAGELAVDESMVTGESLPVLKTKDSVVLGGTVCVESTTTTTTTTKNSTSDAARAGQVAFCQVTGVGSSTALAQIIQLVQDAQASKIPMQNFADTVSAVFVPVVATLSLVTFLVWYALCSSGAVPEEWYHKLNEDAATFSLMFGIASLVISCPCALGLAVPTAIMVGTGVGAKLGVLMKGGEAFEAASQVNAVVLDKTGTVTTGKPVVTDFVLLSSTKKGTKAADENGCNGGAAKRKSPPSLLDEKRLSKETILWLLGSLERSSEHPLAKAIVTYAETALSKSGGGAKGATFLESNPFLQPSEFRSMTGRGASGYLSMNGRDDNRHFVAVGNRAFFATLDIELTEEIDNQMKELEEQGKTAILAAVNYEFTVLLGVADELKPDAAAAVAYLRNEMKIDVWMVTGDNARTAQAIARQLDLPPQRVVSEALPNAKVHQVKKLQQQGKIVAHVGDGINDSPALAQANVGISMGTGAAIAAEASDMVLVRGQYVADVCTALDLCRGIFARIQWNLVWSLIYNCIGIPLAAGVCFPIIHTRLPPTVAALAMALSSVSVVFSSLALRLYKPPVIVPGAATSAVGAGTAGGNRSLGFDVSASAAAASASNAHLYELEEPPKGARQVTTRLSLENGSSNSELTAPLLANQQALEAAAADRMEGGGKTS